MPVARLAQKRGMGERMRLRRIIRWLALAHLAMLTGCGYMSNRMEDYFNPKSNRYACRLIRRTDPAQIPQPTRCQRACRVSADIATAPVILVLHGTLVIVIWSN